MKRSIKNIVKLPSQPESRALISFNQYAKNQKSPIHQCSHKKFKKSGFFKRARDRKKIQRFICLDCKKSFSNAANSIFYRSRKPFVFQKLYWLLSNNSTLRRSALSISVSRPTIRRYFLMLGSHCMKELNREISQHTNSIKQIQFDDIETFEHSKMKPLSITLAVENKSRFILGFSVSEIPARGRFAKRSREKYGERKNCRDIALDSLLEKLTHVVTPDASIWTDKCSSYPKAIKKHFPNARHVATKGRKAAAIGQGELKTGGFDPLFSINHTAAMLRATISRLFRRTWNTTKKMERLFCHLLIYSHFHNKFLLKWPANKY